MLVKRDRIDNQVTSTSEGGRAMVARGGAVVAEAADRLAIALAPVSVDQRSA